jgi:RimJ/RimL family protein N-acetyltransferase
VDTSTPVIKTARLVLRDFRGDDAQRGGNGMAAFVKAFAEQARAKPWAERAHFAWAIPLQDTSEVIGACNLYDATVDSCCATVGWHFSLNCDVSRLRTG